jgi:4-amino-4-deoxy-L-arabinose transferase
VREGLGQGIGGQPGARRGASAAAVLGVFAAACLLLLTGLGRMAARDSTDARYLEIAREMVATGDWLVPCLAGVPHLDKPPLSYWAAAAGFTALGVTPFAGRLLEQLALAATAGVSFAWAYRRLGARPALTAAGVLLTSGLVFVSSRGLHTDFFQLVLLTAALAALFEGSERRSGPTALGFALLGASMLAKGPIALFVALVVLVPFLLLRRERRLPWRGVALGAALFAVIGLPWYGILVLRDPSLLGWFFEHQIVARVASGTEGHRHGALYLPAHLLVGLLPWTPLVALALWRLSERRGARPEPLDTYLVLWALAPIALFGLAATKLATYLLPVFPGAALAVARAQARGLLADRSARRAIAASSALAGVAAFAVAGLVAVESATSGNVAPWLEREELGPTWASAAGLVLAGGFALAVAAKARARSSDWALPRVILATGVTFALGFGVLAPGFADHEADGRLVRSVPGARLIQYGVFEPGLLFYTGTTERSFVAVHARLVRLAQQTPAAAHLGLRREDVAAMVREDVPTFVLAKRKHEQDLGRAMDLRPLHRSVHFVLLGNRAAAATAVSQAPD